ncbi:MAG TPA: hypothetical protein VN700_15325 [Vicinamibacterales bacterium]|nr:hypothetical protein [Vicinamibacterales bacterium]
MAGSGAPGNRRQCPECRVTLTRYEWSKLWWMSSVMSGRLVQPCSECGAALRMSAMVLLSTLSALGLIAVAGIYVFNPITPLLAIALVLLGLMLFSMMTTRLEMVPSTRRGVPADVAPPSRQEAPRV